MPDLTTRQAAERLGVSLNTLVKMADMGDVSCYRTPGGHRRFREEAVDRVIAVREAGEVANADVKAEAWTRAARALLTAADRDLGVGSDAAAPIRAALDLLNRAAPAD